MIINLLRIFLFSSPQNQYPSISAPFIYGQCSSDGRRHAGIRYKWYNAFIIQIWAVAPTKLTQHALAPQTLGQGTKIAERIRVPTGPKGFGCELLCVTWKLHAGEVTWKIQKNDCRRGFFIWGVWYQDILKTNMASVWGVRGWFYP